MKKFEYRLKNFACANCANKIQNKISQNKDYKDVVLNFNTLKLSFYSDLEEKDIEVNIKKIVTQIEPHVEVLKYETKIKSESKVKYHLFRLIIGILFMIIGMLVKTTLASNLLLIISYVVLLSRTASNAIKLLKNKTINENFLITISSIGAYLVGEKLEGLMVIILFEIGKILEEKAVNHSRKSIADLMDIKPEYANLKIGEEYSKVLPESVEKGDIIIIKTGEKIPLDGTVIKGEAKINKVSLTGESRLESVKANDKVLSGSVNEEGIIEIEVTDRYENSTVHKILELVENATDKKAKTETFVNKIAKVYTPVVFGIAIIVSVLLPIILKITYSESIYRALIFLVISCPCAIAISVPLSYFSGIGKSSKEGILIKGSNYLDTLSDISTIIFDKTGTLTKGEFGVEKVVSKSNEYNEKEILEFAALGESFSNHPIAKSILKFNNVELDISKVENFKEISGKGIEYIIDENKIKIGNADFVECQNESEIGTIVYVKIDEKVVGYIVLNDLIKKESKTIVDVLRKMGITTQMFTGDNSEIASKIGEELGINKIKSQMLPQDKYNELEKIIENKKSDKEKIAFVGDGINDSPVLARADIGISMGGVGANSAIEASDVVIMTDNLEKIENAIKISKKTKNIIKQNLIFAIGMKILVLLLSIFGIGQMWLAVFADVGVTLITILNTLRILR